MDSVPSPCYVVDEQRLRGNLQKIKGVADDAGVEIILAFKAFALWKTFPIFREYIRCTTASSPYEARLAYEEFGTRAHTYSPAYEQETFADILRCSSHVTFNSWGQYNQFGAFRAQAEDVSCGLRVNPEYSEIKIDLYNPCAIGSRFGVTADNLPSQLPPNIEGFHVHNHCESTAEAFKRSLEVFERRFAHWLPQLKWINFGGGHLMTRQGYDTECLVRTLRAFRQRHPHLRIILEPGSAFLWQTGTLLSKVVDIVENRGVRTAILNVSFTCHMPDCLEMPYLPEVRGAKALDAVDVRNMEHTYRLGGNSCLSGDFMGYWRFNHELRVGEAIVFEDMIHYTTVKTNMFNGIQHPAIGIRRVDGVFQLLRSFTYDDYKSRMD